MTMTNTTRIKYPLDVHNVYWASSSDDTVTQDRAKRSVVHPFMVPLIEAIQLKRPSWEFAANGYGSHDSNTNVVNHSEFYVFDNGEELCHIDRSYANGSYVYEVKSHRISAKRHIGLSKRSKHPKTITAAIMKDVYPLTLDELANEKYKQAYNVAQHATYKVRREHESNAGILREPMMKFISEKERWSEFEAVLDTPTVMDAKARYHTSVENYRAAKDITTAGHTVLVERPRDIVTKPPTGKAYSTSLEALPDHMKMSLALLKMSDVGVIVNDVGVRTAEDTFYILNKKEV